MNIPPSFFFLFHLPSCNPKPPIVTDGTMYNSPMRKIMILATADCDNYQSLDITGIRDSIVVKEKIFTKVWKFVHQFTVTVVLT